MAYKKRGQKKKKRHGRSPGLVYANITKGRKNDLTIVLKNHIIKSKQR